MMGLLSMELAISALSWILVKGEIVNTPRQSVSWNQVTYTLLTGVGYNRAISPFTFEVKTCSDAHVGLMELNDGANPGRIYEIAIGGWGNTKSVLRSVKQQNPAEDTHIESNLLDCNAFRPFQITWDSNGLVKVYKYVNDGTTNCILSWTDTSPFTVNYIGVTTGPSGNGVWNISNPETTTTETITSTVSWSTTTIDTSTTSITTSTVASISISTSDTSTSGTAVTSISTSGTMSTSISTSGSTSTSTQSNSGTTNQEPTNSQSTHLTTYSSILATVTDTILTTSTQDSKSTQTTSLCSCNCVTTNKTYSQEELEEEIQKLRANLLVVKSKTSKSIRSKISANDSRTSSKVMGVTACIILTVMLGGIVLLDLPNLIFMIKKIRLSLAGGR